MLLPYGNPFKCHEEVMYLQPIIPPKRFDIFPLTGGCSKGLDAFRFFFKSKLCHKQHCSCRLLSLSLSLHDARKKQTNSGHQCLYRFNGCWPRFVLAHKKNTASTTPPRLFGSSHHFLRRHKTASAGPTG